jgi:hypothetical protein
VKEVQKEILSKAKVSAKIEKQRKIIDKLTLDINMTEDIVYS